MNKKQSRCCKAPVKEVGDVTMHYECTKCGKPTDLYVDKDKKEFWEIDTLQNYIIVCPDCGKVDIIPKTHKPICDPKMEAMRQDNLSYYE